MGIYVWVDLPVTEMYLGLTSHPSMGRHSEYWQWSSGHHKERNSKFYMTWTAGILA